MEESFDLMVPGIEEKSEDKKPEVMKNTFKDLGVIIGFIFIYIILYQYVSTGDISNGIDLQNDVNLILSDTQNFAFVPNSTQSSVPASDSSPSPGSDPASGSSSTPSSDPASGSSSTPGSDPASDSSSTPGSDPVSGSSSTPSSDPASGSSSTPGSDPASGSSSTPGSDPASGSSSTPSSDPVSGSSSGQSSLPASVPASSSTPSSVPSPSSSPTSSSTPTSAPSPSSSPTSSSAPTPVPSPSSSPAPTESPNPIIIKPKIHEIRMDINGFYPNFMSINKSETIIWTSVEDQRPRVVLISKDGLFQNQVLIESDRFEYKFLKKGNYSFSLAENPSLIEYQKAKGNVTVN